MSAQISETPRKPILAAIDLSAHSEAVLRFAAEFARWGETPLLVLHVIHEPASEPGFYRSHDDSRASLPIDLLARRMMEKFMDDMKQRWPVFQSARVIMVEGLPTQRILEVAEQENAAMIVMSSHGRKNLSRFVMGSVAEKVSRHSEVPVTIVKGFWQGWEQMLELSQYPAGNDGGLGNDNVGFQTA